MAAAVCQGLKVPKATITTDDHGRGAVTGSMIPRSYLDQIQAGVAPFPPRFRDWVEKRVRVYLAGGVAHKKFSPHGRISGVDDDLAMALRYVGTLVGVNVFEKLPADEQKELDAHIDLLKIQTERLIKDHWSTVEALAAALLERKTLNGKEIHQIVKQDIQHQLKLREPRRHRGDNLMASTKPLAPSTKL